MTLFWVGVFLLVTLSVGMMEGTGKVTTYKRELGEQALGWARREYASAYQDRNTKQSRLKEAKRYRRLAEKERGGRRTRLLQAAQYLEGGDR